MAFDKNPEGFKEISHRDFSWGTALQAEETAPWNGVNQAGKDIFQGSKCIFRYKAMMLGNITQEVMLEKRLKD